MNFMLISSTYRRLTVAAQEISKKNENIVDIAFKYGFESHEAFSRAFKNWI